MTEEDTCGMEVLDLEPLEPFLDDVFAGMDDHPPGLWHPTLLEASVGQQPASHNANAADTRGLGLVVEQQTVEQLSLSYDTGLNCLAADSEQLQTAKEQPQALPQQDGQLPPVQLQQHLLSVTRSSTVGNNTEEVTQAVSCTMLQTAGEAIEVLDLQCSQSSSTLSPVAAADELTASSNSLDLEAGAAFLVDHNSVGVLLHSSVNMQRQRTEAISGSEGAATGMPTVDVGIGITGTLAVGPSEGICGTAATAYSISTQPAEPVSPRGSVPDIDEVPEEQQQVVCETLSPSQPSPATSTHTEEHHQQRKLGTMECRDEAQQKDGPIAAQSEQYQDIQQWQEQRQEQPLEQQQEQGQQDLEHDDPEHSRQLASSLADHVVEGAHYVSAASTAYHHAAGSIQPDGSCSLLVGAAADTPVLYATDTPAADVEENDSGEFVSPSTSWHSCTTQASHATSYSVMSAASFATTRGLSALSVAARLAEQQPAQVQQQLQQVHGEGDTSIRGLTGAAAGHQTVHCGAVPAALNRFGSSATAAGNECPAIAPVGHNSSKCPCGVQPSAADHQPKQPLSEPMKQQLQQQQWQQELWQDVSPPSLGSSPPTPNGYTTVRPLHMRGVTTAAATAGIAGAGEEGAPAQPGAALQSTAAAPETSDNVVDEGHGQYYSEELSVQLPDDLGFVARGGQAAAADGAGAAYQHLTGARTGLYRHNVPIANSSYMLRQSELVDLSLSTSVHPSQHQHFRPSWLTAHQQLPPAAAQAVERAACALNDSYFFHERLGRSPLQQQRQQQQSATMQSAHGVRSESPSDSSSKPADGAHPPGGTSAGGLGASGLLGPELLRRSGGGGGPWSHASTQPQQDQQARHRVPCHGAQQSALSRPGLLGQWFTSTVQQPLAAAASLAAAGVGQRLAAAGLKPASNVNLGAASVASSGSAANVLHVGEPADGNSSAGTCDVEIQDAVFIEHTPDLPQSLQEQEDTAFQGLLFLGGQDSHGRPVVIINTDAVPSGHNSAPRDAALAYLLSKLTPVVSRGPYVLVLVAFHHGPQFRLLPAVWCVRAYHSLPRAFRKNVKHVVLLQPSLMVRAGLALLYPFVNSKAHAKIKQVYRLLDIESATSGEVQVPHLGEAFLTTVQQFSKAQHQGTAGQAADGTSRTVPVPGAQKD